MYKLMFYLTIVNKVLRHCQVRLARQYVIFVFRLGLRYIWVRSSLHLGERDTISAVYLRIESYSSAFH